MDNIYIIHIMRLNGGAGALFRVMVGMEGAEEEILPVADLEGVRALILELHPHIIGAAKVSALVKDLEARGFSLREKIHKTYFLER